MINEIPQSRCSKSWLWGYSNDNSLALSTKSSLSLSLSVHPLTTASFHAAEERAKTPLKWNQIKERKDIFPFKNHIVLSYPFTKYKQCGAFIRPAFIVQSKRVPHTLIHNPIYAFFITTHISLFTSVGKLLLLLGIVRSRRCLILRTDGAHQISHK